MSASTSSFPRPLSSQRYPSVTKPLERGCVVSTAISSELWPRLRRPGSWFWGRYRDRSAPLRHPTLSVWLSAYRRIFAPLTFTGMSMPSCVGCRSRCRLMARKCQLCRSNLPRGSWMRQYNYMQTEALRWVRVASRAEYLIHRR